MADKPSKPIAPSAQMTVMKPDDPSPAAPPPRAGKSLPIGSMLGKYKIQSILGSGGMGTVYAAEDSVIKRRVAIKVLPPDLARDKSLINRLLAEAQAAGNLNHANVVTIYDVGETGGSYYIVMELVAGGSVQDYLARKGSPGWRAATRLIAEAAKALAAAHETGLIHRDIKPSNLMLTNDGHVKVVDFGLAKVEAADSTLNTQPGSILGTPAFMSPEQCRGDKLDARTDIYSLGCTYYAMLTGKPPFEAATSMQVMFAHCSAPIPDPRDLNADTPEPCVEILTRALAKNPGDRYANARDMVNDLRAALAGAPTLMNASPIAALSEAASIQAPVMDYFAPPKNRPRNKIILAVTAGIFLFMLVVAGLFFFSASSSSTAMTGPVGIMSNQTTASRQIAPTGAPASSAVGETPTTEPDDPFFGFNPVTKPAVTGTNLLPDVPATPPGVALVGPSGKPPVVGPVHAPPATPAKPLDALITNSIDQRLVLIKPGKFTMGDEHLTDAPPHTVSLTHAIYLGSTEVSQGEYAKVMGKIEGPEGNHEELPASTVSWEQAADFCRRLTAMDSEKAAGRSYRLPTEAEWEYACRAGTKTKYAFGDTITNEQANFGKKIDLATLRKNDPSAGPNDRERPGQRIARGIIERNLPPEQPPGQPPQPPKDQNQPPAAGKSPPDGNGPPGGKEPPDRRLERAQHPLEKPDKFSPNAWGLYGMHGSVWEWCSDFYAADGYRTRGVSIDPTGPESGTTHVARGGAWNSPVNLCTSAYRNGKPDYSPHEPLFGFRVVCEVAP